jgi:excisionase family DNA binding protein
MFLSLITLLVGLLILFKGDLQLLGRYIPKAQARIIAFVLMSPLPLLFCASTLLAFNYVQVSPNGTVSFDADTIYAVSDTLFTIEIIAVILAIGYTAISIYNAPQTPAAASPDTSLPPTPSRPPDIMTVKEAAAYMRVSEAEILHLIDAGKLGAARIGDSYRIARIAIEDFMQGASG